MFNILRNKRHVKFTAAKLGLRGKLFEDVDAVERICSCSEYHDIPFLLVASVKLSAIMAIVRTSYIVRPSSIR